MTIGSDELMKENGVRPALKPGPFLPELHVFFLQGIRQFCQIPGKHGISYGVVLFPHFFKTLKNKQQ
jgi:hypothetical protein